MLLIFSLGLMVNLALFCDGCKVGPWGVKHFDWDKFIGCGTWYYKLHYSSVIENDFDCLMGTIANPEGNSSLVSCAAFVTREQRTMKAYGYSTNWNSSGYLEFYGFFSIWSGRYYVIAIDYDSYVIFKHCPFDSDQLFVYVLYRGPHPEETTVNRVRKELREKNIDVSQLREFSTDHCQQVESS